MPLFTSVVVKRFFWGVFFLPVPAFTQRLRLASSTLADGGIALIFVADAILATIWMRIGGHGGVRTREHLLRAAKRQATGVMPPAGSSIARCAPCCR